MNIFEAVGLCVAVVGATVSGMTQNWPAMAWAICAGIWVIIASLNRRS